MTSDFKLDDAQTGRLLFSELESRFELGDKTALYEAIAISSQRDVRLPAWAADELRDMVIDRWRGKVKTWKGTKQPLNSGYKKLLANYVRSQVFRSIKAFFKDKNRYRGMPTACIQAWYDGKLKNIPEDDEGAVAIANIALSQIFCGAAAFETFEDQMSFKPEKTAAKKAKAIVSLEKIAAKQSPVIFADDNQFSDETNTYSDDDAELFFREILELPLSFGYRDSEVVFGLRQDGQFWGPPPGDPPDHIIGLIKAM